MDIDDLIILSYDIYEDMAANRRSDWNKLEDYIAGLSYARVNELLRYLPSLSSLHHAVDFARYSVLVSMLEDAKAQMEEEN